MEIYGKEVPITATHYNFESGEFIRLSNGIYAEWLCGKYWTSCSVTKNTDLPIKFSGVGGKYMRIFKTGISRDLCNIRLFFIGSSYRV